MIFYDTGEGSSFVSAAGGAAKVQLGEFGS